MSPRHRVLIVGIGSIGERHLRCFQTTGRGDVSVVDINDRLRATICERYGVRGFADLESAAKSCDAAVIAVPADQHVEIATKLAAAGVHVLIEKPLGTRLDGVDCLARTARERGVVIGVAYVYRCSSSLAAMRDAVRSGRFGRPVEMVSITGQHFPTHRPAYREIYYADRATGGGAIQDALTHLLNVGEWLVGPIDRLVADAAHLVLEGVTVEDTAHVLARHGEALACYSLNQHQAPHEIILTVMCERGTLRWEGHANRWQWMQKSEDGWKQEPNVSQLRDDLFIAQAHGFLDAIEGRTPPLCTLEEGAQTLRAVLAALASVESGLWQNTRTSS
jgi:predicted dehydrogenase